MPQLGTMMPMKQREESIPSFERTRRQRAWLPPVVAERSVAPALLRWWRAAQRGAAETRVYNPRPDRLSVASKLRCTVAKFKRNDEGFFLTH